MPRPPTPPRDRTKTEHIGVVDKLVFTNTSRDWCILATTEGHTVIGPADGDLFPRGVAFKWFGRWEDDPQRGPRFRFQTFVQHIGHSRTGIVSYLSKTCGGVGERTADKLWQKFGGDAVRLLREEPARVAAECNLSADVCQEASTELAKASRTESTRVELFGLFASRGFPGALIERVIEKFDVRAPQMIRRNPFVLLGLPGAGFRRCDRMWTDFKLPTDSLKRAGLCAAHILASDSTGHTWMPAVDVAARLKDAAPGADPVRAFKFALRVRKLKKHRDAADKLWLAGYARATSEERIAAAVTRLSWSPSLWPADRVPVSRTDGDRLPSAHQVAKLRRATRSPIGILIGGPGTGKSHLTAYLVREILKSYGQDNILACAPTGKAAVRMTQAFGLAGIDMTARTIHSTLEIGRNGHDGDGWGFLRNRDNPLDAKFVLADEASMDDTGLMADLLDAIPAGGHILLIGDPYQLPPVGHGAPLRDLIAAGVPHGELTEVRRNAGQIVHACVRIKNGESFDACTSAGDVDLSATPPKNLLLYEAKDEAKSVEVLCDILKRMTTFNPTWQTQVIVARNTKGEISRKALNEKLHPMLNPDGYAVKDNPFKVGDKIICTRNSRMHRVEPFAGMSRHGHAKELADRLDVDAATYEVVRDYDSQPEEVYVANGEIGRVVAVAPRLTIARFSEADALVKIPMGRQKDEDEDGGEDEGGGRGCNFDHAYAVTGHRMQGSECPCVIVMGDDQAGMLTTREWLYTAVSRASKLCILIGKRSTFDKMRGKVALNKRKTFLRERVFEALTEGL